MVQCPHCKQPAVGLAESPPSGTREMTECAGCRKPFEVYRFRRHVPTMVAARAETADGTCVGHPNNRAVGVCERCGDFICNLCATPCEGRSYCPKCFDLLFTRGALESSQRAFVTPKMALNAAVLSLLLGWVQCIGLLLGPVSIYLAIRSLNEIKRRPELPGKNQAIAAIIIGSISILVGVGISAWAIWLGINAK